MIHFVSDNATDISYHISGAAQKRATNWLATLRSSSFKTSLLEFLVSAWSNSDYASLFEGKILSTNSGNICYKFMSILDKVVRTKERSLLCTPEKADSLIFFHVSFLENQSNVVIRTINADCLIIRLGCCEKLDSSLKIWLEFRVQSRNNLRFISVDSIYSNLGKNFCKALPGYHAFTGSDFTASFSRKGNIQPLKKLEKDARAQIPFGHLGQLGDDQSNNFAEIEKFTCKMYGKKNLKKIDDVRTEIVMKSTSQ